MEMTMFERLTSKDDQIKNLKTELVYAEETKKILQKEFVDDIIKTMGLFDTTVVLETFEKILENVIESKEVQRRLEDNSTMLPNFDEIIALYTIVSEHTSSNATEMLAARPPLYVKHNRDMRGKLNGERPVY